MVALGYDVRDVRRNYSTTYLQGKELTDRSQSPQATHF